MAGRLTALLVGIDAYLPPVNALYGCRNDIAAMQTYLARRAGSGGVDVMTLLDGEATRDAVVAAFRAHLGSAGEGDVALFAYAGHGSEEPAPAEVAHLEPTGRIQTLVLYDCGRRIDGKLRRGLADKELSVLIAEVAARGAHVVVVLDCCHAGGATRDVDVNVRGWTPDPETTPADLRELVTEMTQPRPVTEFLPGTTEHWTAPSAPHVALSACRSFEKAKELHESGTLQGAFSTGLVAALSALGPSSTYRSVLATARAHVERVVDEQRPEMFPLDPGGAGDGLFLDGRVTPVPASFTMSRGRDGWEIDGGSLHGFAPPRGEEAFTLACTRPGGQAGEIAGYARVTGVEIQRSAVEPVDWQPEEVAYETVIAEVPLPPATVTFDLAGDGVSAEDVTSVVDRVKAALATGGPGGSPSPYVAVGAEENGGASGEGGAAAGGFRLRLGVPMAGSARIARSDGSPVTADTPVADEDGVRRVVARLEHVARWEQVRALGGHRSTLDGAVDLAIFPAEPGETVRPEDRAPLAATGSYELTYRRADDGLPSPPHVFIEVHNTSDEDLWVAVLDLTDRFRCHAVLPTVRLAAGHRHGLWDGVAIPVALPAGRAVEPGALARDWLKLIVSDVDFEATSFDLPALDEPPVERPVERSDRPRGVLERLAAKAVSREIPDTPPPAVSQWTATTVVLETTVP